MPDVKTLLQATVESGASDLHVSAGMPPSSSPASGNSLINGSMLHAGLIDEVSLLVAPVADGRIGTPALFDIDDDNVAPTRLVLDHVERRADDVLWLRYRVELRAR